jgi:hypothetical protein
VRVLQGEAEMHQVLLIRAVAKNPGGNPIKTCIFAVTDGETESFSTLQAIQAWLRLKVLAKGKHWLI